MNDLERYQKEIHDALLTLDLNHARRHLPFASDDQIRLCAMHKARYELTTMPADARHASRDWLERNGYKRLNGADWPPDGMLPD